MSDDKEIVYAMQDTWDFGNSQKLRNIFAILLNFGEISKPREIFDKFIDDMIADIEHENPLVVNKSDIINKCLKEEGQLIPPLKFPLMLTVIPPVTLEHKALKLQS